MNQGSMDEPFPGLRHELAVDPWNQGSEHAIADLVRFLNAVTDIAVLANHCQDDLEPVVDLLLGQGIDAANLLPCRRERADLKPGGRTS